MYILLKKKTSQNAGVPKRFRNEIWRCFIAIQVLFGAFHCLEARCKLQTGTAFIMPVYFSLFNRTFSLKLAKMKASSNLLATV